MLEVLFEINGKKITSKLRLIHCSIHKQDGKIKIKGKNLSNLSFEISGCCEELKEQVKKVLS